MTSEFDKLLATVEKMNNIKGEECMICHFPDTAKNLIKLKCKHFYHKDCIGITETTNKIKCPYCKKSSSYKHINSNNKEIKMIKEPGLLCLAIIKSGAKKGLACGRINCKYHKKDNIIIGCNEIIKSGIKKGNICGRINCKYHKKTINLTV